MSFPIDITYKKEPVPIDIHFGGSRYTGMAIPVSATCREGVCFELDITLNNKHLGIIHYRNDQWQMEGADPGLVEAIGQEIMLWYE